MGVHVYLGFLAIPQNTSGIPIPHGKFTVNFDPMWKESCLGIRGIFRYFFLYFENVKNTWPFMNSFSLSTEPVIGSLSLQSLLSVRLVYRACYQFD